MADYEPSKAERTREAIVDAALELIRERGYEAATMREIARRAGVSLGNAYYYFRSKEHLIQAFYERNQAAHDAACRAALRGERAFGRRLQAVLKAHVKALAPQHEVVLALFRSAAAPGSALSPFGDEAEPVRRASIALFAEVVEGSAERVPEDLAGALPRLLWLLHLGVVLYWIHDRSAGRRRTLKLIDGLSSLAATALALASLPLTGALRRQVVAVLDDAWPGAA